MATKEFILSVSDIEKTNNDLIVYHYGMEECKAGHSFGPALRDHFLIHYIISGSGRFYVDGKMYELHENQGFLIIPEVITYYEASASDPWVYSWVGFKGYKAEAYLKLANLNRNNPIFYYKGEIIKQCFEDITNSNRYKHGFELRLMGLLSIFLSELIENAELNNVQSDSYSDKEKYIKRSLQYVEANYSRDISISSLAEYIGLNKNYFSTFFRENIGMTPQQYLINFRINKACELLKNKSLSISEISRSVGYPDPLGFSKIFKQIKETSPKGYRERIFTSSD
jgi:AraC-like DNA-binding protein